MVRGEIQKNQRKHQNKLFLLGWHMSLPQKDTAKIDERANLSHIMHQRRG